jgi:hypothetical protein
MWSSYVLTLICVYHLLLQGQRLLYISRTDFICYLVACKYASNQSSAKLSSPSCYLLFITMIFATFRWEIGGYQQDSMKASLIVTQRLLARGPGWAWGVNVASVAAFHRPCVQRRFGGAICGRHVCLPTLYVEKVVVGHSWSWRVAHTEISMSRLTLTPRWAQLAWTNTHQVGSWNTDVSEMHSL